MIQKDSRSFIKSKDDWGQDQPVHIKVRNKKDEEADESSDSKDYGSRQQQSDRVSFHNVSFLQESGSVKIKAVFTEDLYGRISCFFIIEDPLVLVDFV